MAGNNIYVKGSYIDIHDNQNVYLSVDKAQVRVGDNGAEVTEEVSKVESPDTGRTSAPAAPAPLTANQKVTACFEHGLLTAGKPYNQLFCLMAAMMATYAITRISWKLNKLTNAFFTLGLTIPIQASIVPVYVVLSKRLFL